MYLVGGDVFIKKNKDMNKWQSDNDCRTGPLHSNPKVITVMIFTQIAPQNRFLVRNRISSMAFCHLLLIISILYNTIALCNRTRNPHLKNILMQSLQAILNGFNQFYISGVCLHTK